MNLQAADSCDLTAGSCSWKAQSRDLYGTHEDALPAAAADWSTLDWATYPSPAGKGSKPSQGARGTASLAVCGGSAAAGSPLLDSYTNNRHNASPLPQYAQRPKGRGKFCGRLCCCGTDPKTGRKRFQRINCNAWTCSYCGPRKAKRAKRAIRERAEGMGLRYFLTLTLDPSKLENPQFAVAHLRLVFNKFREYLRRKFGAAPTYICVLEFTQKKIPHLHILLDRYIDHAWISDVWDSLGGGRIVFIKRVTINKVSNYLSKYLTKDLILSAPKGSRRITTARSIKLFPKFESGIAWELLESSIWRALEEVRAANPERQADLFKGVGNMQYDEENFLKSFEVMGVV